MPDNKMIETLQTTKGITPALIQEVCTNYTDREIVYSFFKQFEASGLQTLDETIIYHQLQCLYSNEDDRYIHLNKLAGIFLEQNKKCIAYRYLLESLRLNCRQPHIYELACLLQKDTQPRFPEKLKGNRCAVSVLMSTYNRPELIKESIESVLNQTFQNFELIIINDGGTDEVEDTIESFNSSKIKYLKLERVGGYNRARVINYGLTQAEGKYISYLDDDDIYYPDHLELLFKAARNSDGKFLYTNTQDVEGMVEGGIFRRAKIGKVRAENFNKDILLYRLFLTGCSVMHEKAILKNTGLFNEGLEESEDWDMWLSCAQKYEFRHIDKITCEYRKNQYSVSRKNKLKISFNARINCAYHGFFQGKTAFIKFYLGEGRRDEALGLYKEVRSQYPYSPKSIDIIQELLRIARQFNDNKFLVLLSKDYFHFDARACLKTLAIEKSIYMFAGIAPQLLVKIIKSSRARITHFLKIKEAGK